MRIIDEYMDFLLQKEFIVCMTELDTGFSKFNPVYEVPNAITNCIIDFDEQSDHPLTTIKQQLDSLICQALQLRYYCALSLQTLNEHLSYFADSRLRSIEILLPFSDELSDESIIELNKKHPRLLSVMIYNAPESRKNRIDAGGVKVYCTTAAIESEN